MRKSIEMYVDSRDRVETRAMGVKIAEGESQVTRRLTEESEPRLMLKTLGRKISPRAVQREGLEAVRQRQEGQLWRSDEGWVVGRMLKDSIHPFVHSFIHSVDKYFVLKYVPVSVLALGIRQWAKQSKTKHSCPNKAYFLVRGDTL